MVLKQERGKNLSEGVLATASERADESTRGAKVRFRQAGDRNIGLAESSWMATSAEIVITHWGIRH